MNDISAIPLVAVFGVAVLLLLRSREVRPWVALTFFLFGIYVGETSWVSPITDAVSSLLSKFV